MSVSFLATVVLGFHLTEKQCYTTSRYRGCAHREIPSENVCPQCNRPMWKEAASRLDSLNSAVFEIKHINWEGSRRANEDHYGAGVGLVLPVQKNGSFKVPAEEHWPQIKQDLVSVLATHGIVPASEFSAHLVQFVAY